MLWNKLPYSSTSSDVQLQTKKRRELVGLKQELNATSAQDQFAKWARLDRQFSRMQAEYDNKGTIVYYPFSVELYVWAKYKVHPAIQANTHSSFLSSQRS